MYPLFARYHEKKIAMFHHGRCGSTVIGKMLNDHPRLYWAGEPFHTSAIKQRVQNREIQFHEMIRWSQYEAGPRYYGFEIKYRQLSILGIQSQAFLEDLCALRFNYFIHLHRKNVLRQLISSLIGQQAGYWHLSVNSDPQQSTIHLSPDGLIPQLDSAIQAVRHFSDLLSTMNVLEINYEDHIMEDPRIAYERICAFVGFPVSITTYIASIRTDDR